MGSYVEARKEEICLKSFDYDNRERVFNIGNQSFELSQNLPTLQIGGVVLAKPERNDIYTAPVCLNQFGNPIGSRNFHEWLGGLVSSGGLTSSTKQSTLEVMKSVLVTLDPIEIPEVSNPGHVSFNFNLDEYNHITLHTYGDCACLGPFPEGMWVSDSDWKDEGLCEYTFHNVWAETQRWSLLAGMGHLARLAAQEQ